MGITDKLTGKVKQAAGDLTGDDELQGRGHKEERKAEVKAERDRQQERAQQQVDQVESGAAGRRDEEKLKDDLAWEKGREKQVESLEKQT